MQNPNAYETYMTWKNESDRAYYAVLDAISTGDLQQEVDARQELESAWAARAIAFRAWMRGEDVLLAQGDALLQAEGAQK
jgi:hypothetical protein